MQILGSTKTLYITLFAKVVWTCASCLLNTALILPLSMTTTTAPFFTRLQMRMYASSCSDMVPMSMRARKAAAVTNSGSVTNKTRQAKWRAGNQEQSKRAARDGMRALRAQRKGRAS